MTNANDEIEARELSSETARHFDFVENKALSEQFDSTVLADKISGLIDDLERLLDPVLLPDNETTPGITNDESRVMSSFYVIEQRLERLKQRIHV